MNLTGDEALADRERWATECWQTARTQRERDHWRAYRTAVIDDRHAAFGKSTFRQYSPALKDKHVPDALYEGDGLMLDAEESWFARHPDRRLIGFYALRRAVRQLLPDHLADLRDEHRDWSEDPVTGDDEEPLFDSYAQWELDAIADDIAHHWLDAAINYE